MCPRNVPASRPGAKPGKTRKWADSREKQHFFAPLRKWTTGLSLCCAGEEARSGNSFRSEHFPYSPWAESEVCDLLFRREARQSLTTSLSTQHCDDAPGSSPRRLTLLTVVAGDSEPRTRQQEEGAEAQQEVRNPEGLGGGCALLSSHRPYQAA